MSLEERRFFAALYSFVADIAGGGFEAEPLCRIAAQKLLSRAEDEQRADEVERAQLEVEVPWGDSF